MRLSQCVLPVFVDNGVAVTSQVPALTMGSIVKIIPVRDKAKFQYGARSGYQDEQPQPLCYEHNGECLAQNEVNGPDRAHSRHAQRHSCIIDMHGHINLERQNAPPFVPLLFANFGDGLAKVSEHDTWTN